MTGRRHGAGMYTTEPVDIIDTAIRRQHPYQCFGCG